MSRAYPERQGSLRNSQMAKNGTPRRSASSCHVLTFGGFFDFSTGAAAGGRHSQPFESFTTIPGVPDIHETYSTRSRPRMWY